MSPKSSITQRLRTDLGQVSRGNDGYTNGVVTPVNRIHSPLSPKQLCKRGDEHLGIILQFDKFWYVKYTKKMTWITALLGRKKIPIAIMFYENILEHCSVRLHSSCGTDLGRSIKMATENSRSIGVVTPGYGISTSPLTATAVLSKGHI